MDGYEEKTAVLNAQTHVPFCSEDECSHYSATTCKCNLGFCASCFQKHQCPLESKLENTPKWVASCEVSLRSKMWTAAAELLLQNVGQYQEVKYYMPRLLGQSSDALLTGLHLLEQLGSPGRNKRQAAAIQGLVVEAMKDHQAAVNGQHKVFGQELNARDLLPISVWAHLIKALQLPMSEEIAATYVRKRLTPDTIRDILQFLKILELPHVLETSEAIAMIVRKGDVPLLIEYAKDNSATQAMAVNALGRSGNTNQAIKCIRDWHLPLEDYPEITLVANKKSLKWMVAAGKALEFGEMVCGETKELQSFLVEDLSNQPEQTRPFLHFATMWDWIGKGNAQVAAKIARAQVGPLTELAPPAGDWMLLPSDIVVMTVDGASTLTTANAILSLPTTDMIGLDVECLPGFLSGENVPKILQVGCRSHVFIFDLDTFDAAMDEVLFRALSNPKILKLGFGFGGDLKGLRKYFPMANTFKSGTLAPMLDFETLSGEVTRKCGQKVSGLANLCKALLGKPLDKTQQMSNWGRRPLSPAQLHYAALDAYCLLPLQKALRGT